MQWCCVMQSQGKTRQSNRSAALLVLAAALLYPLNSGATAEYARQTGKGCGVCHFEPSGGGQLTKEGMVFRDELRIKGLYKPLTRTQQIARFIIGYIHSMTAIIWFGAILYVHILLKPAYAARGLPRGELILGWSSIAIMTVTGTLLTIARVPTWHALFHTRFGILLTIKIILFLAMVSSAVIVTFVIGPRLKKRKETALLEQKQDLTIEELRQFDGKDGRPGYIAYEGVIYNVSSSKLWSGGAHMKKHAAGADLTALLKTAPHNDDRLAKMPVVGRLVGERGAKSQEKPKFFFFLAYMNLVVVFLIVFVISLWRWW